MGLFCEDVRTEEGFDHPPGLVVSAQGKIVRYLYGTDPPPMAVALAINEAAQGRMARKAAQFERAREFVSPDGFLNAAPFLLVDLVGKKVVLLDFWTYGCESCQRTIPRPTEWQGRYRDDGLVIVGVHSPEFPSEQRLENVSAAVMAWGISSPVVLDNHHAIWRAYDNQYRPTAYLIDIDGFIVARAIGEGDEEGFEQQIRSALAERREVLKDRPAPEAQATKPR